MLRIGSIISNRVILAMTHKFVLAKCVEESPEPFTVWRLYDDMSGVHSGSYFKDKMDAEWEFCSLAFPWFQDNVIISDPDEETAPEGQAQGQVKIDYISNGSQGISQAIEQINQAKKVKQNIIYYSDKMFMDCLRELLVDLDQAYADKNPRHM